MERPMRVNVRGDDFRSVVGRPWFELAEKTVGLFKIKDVSQSINPIGIGYLSRKGEVRNVRLLSGPSLLRRPLRFRERPFSLRMSGGCSFASSMRPLLVLPPPEYDQRLKGRTEP